MSVSPAGTYTEVELPAGGAPWSSLAWTISPRSDPSPDGYYWAHQFVFVDLDGHRVGGGYAGLQTVGAGIGGPAAVFSIAAGARAARGPGIVHGDFDGDAGWSTRCAYDWRVGRRYRFALTTDRVDGNGRWWRCDLTDLDTSGRVEVAEIATPPEWVGFADWSVMWTERYAGPLRSCADLRHAVADFTDVVAGDVARPERLTSRVDERGTCRNSSVVAIDGGVRQEMGVPVADAPTRRAWWRHRFGSG